MRCILLALGVSLIFIGAIKCTPSQRAFLKREAVSVADCGLATSIACTSQAVGACAVPSDHWSSQDWSGYSSCLADHSMACSGAGLARCLLNGVRDIFRDSPIITLRTVSTDGARVACSGEESRTRVLACVRDTEAPETQNEAVEMVSWCIRQECLGDGVN